MTGYWCYYVLKTNRTTHTQQCVLYQQCYIFFHCVKNNMDDLFFQTRRWSNLRLTEDQCHGKSVSGELSWYLTFMYIPRGLKPRHFWELISVKELYQWYLQLYQLTITRRVHLKLHMLGKCWFFNLTESFPTFFVYICI